jgi:protein TonB
MYVCRYGPRLSANPCRLVILMLARQMKVEGSVILQALIGRDGLIQDLRVLSGPPILATAGEEAVKQWHFKPHVKGAETVETQTRITVNFTISTN